MGSSMNRRGGADVYKTTFDMMVKEKERRGRKREQKYRCGKITNRQKRKLKWISCNSDFERQELRRLKE